MGNRFTAPQEAQMIKVGDKFPEGVSVQIAFKENHKIETLVGKGKILVVTLPGAFTPTWSTCQVPGLKKAEIDGRLEEAGIDKVYVMCVNDAAVMQAWKKDQGLAGSEMIEFIADKDADLTNALGIRLTGGDKPYGQFDGPNNALGMNSNRCKRTAMYCVDGVVKAMGISEGPGPEGQADPAGDDFPQSSCIEAMLEKIAAA